MNHLFKIKKSPEYVFGYLTDMQKFASAHPVITRIDKRNEDSYLVHESMKLGFIPISFTYPVTVTPYPRAKLIVMQATVMSLTKIEMTFLLTPSGEFTIVTESTSFKTPLPIVGILQRIFEIQHKQLLKNIEAAK